MAAALTSVVEHTAAAYGCTARVRLIDSEPPLHNDAALASATTAVLRESATPSSTTSAPSAPTTSRSTAGPSTP